MSLAWSLVLVGVMLATVIDWRSRRVPNWLTLALIMAGLLIGAITNGFSGFLQSLGGALLGLILLIYPFSMGWMGGGDVKLLTAVGALTGPYAVLWVALYGAIAGGLGSLTLIVYRTAQAGELLAQLKVSLLAIGIWLTQLFLQGKGNYPSTVLPSTKAAMREKFPYAFAIAAGTIMVLWQGHP